MNGVVHTHSRYATAFAAVGRSIPVYLTAQADEFGGEIPCAGFALIGDEAIGELVVDGDRTVAGDPAAGTTASSPSEPTAERRGEVGGDGRGHRRDGLGRPPARHADVSPDDVVERLHHRYTTEYGQ